MHKRKTDNTEHHLERKQTMITRRATAVSATTPYLAPLLLFALTASLHGQGILTATPGRTVITTAGTGPMGYSGDTPAQPPPRPWPTPPP
jgi:hypothetical protein